MNKKHIRTEKLPSSRPCGGIELADVVRQFLGDYMSRFGQVMLPSQKKALADISACCTLKLGGRLHQCDDCSKEFWIYHGCRNRSCPKCHGSHTQQWLRQREAELLPCDYYHVVVTVPQQLRHATLSDQKYLYGLLMRISAEVLKEMASDKRHLGAMPGILSVLHTWTAQLMYHPHVHMLVTGGGITEDGKSWREPRHKFLVPVTAYSEIVCARFRDTLQAEKPEVFAKVDPRVWTCNWCCYCKHYGNGHEAVLRYLSRYVHRIAICNSRILAMDSTHVTFRYKDHDANQWRTMRLAGVEFLRRFLIHVLPRGFHKVRYYGLWHSSRRDQAARAWLLLTLDNLAARNSPRKIIELLRDMEQPDARDAWNGNDVDREQDRIACPHCGSHRTQVILETQRPGIP